MTQRIARIALVVLLVIPAVAVARQKAASPAPPAVSAPAASAQSQAAFMQAADQVLERMSKLLDLPILHPLKKSLRSKAQIRAYLVESEKEDKHPAKRYADKKALVAFGLIPPGFDLEGFMLNLLTNQIAGYYDPKAQQFYIADWIPLSEQRMVMAHELTHALDDQHFHIETWLKAARPNDDAEAARQAVLEGSAVVAMFDYQLSGMGRSVRDMPDIGPITQLILGQDSDSSDFASAPPYIRDSLLFPYMSGAVYTQQVLKAGSGWKDFQQVFQRPPVSTQQILQPSYYLAGKAPSPVTFPDLKKLLGKRWNLLDENVAGSFGLKEVVKQYLGEQSGAEYAREWWGDRYAILEDRQTKSSLLLFRLRLDSDQHATDFFSVYSGLLRKKHVDAKDVFTAPEFLEFNTAGGGVFFECRLDECFSMEGANRQAFDSVTKAMGWLAAPQPPGTVARNLPPRPASIPVPALH